MAASQARAGASPRKRSRPRYAFRKTSCVMSSASLSPTARTIHRCTAGVCRRTNAPNASSSPPRAEARSSSSVVSGSVNGESRRTFAGGAGAILRPNRAELPLPVRVGRVGRLESARAVPGIEVVLAGEHAQTHELGPNLVGQRDARRGRRIFLEVHPSDGEARLVADSRRRELVGILSPGAVARLRTRRFGLARGAGSALRRPFLRLRLAILVHRDRRP